MGAWGFNILEDDVARDMHGDYIERYNGGAPHDVILEQMIADSAELLADPDDAPVFWLGVARAQWDCGALAASVLKRVREIVEQGEGLGRWEDAGPKSLQRRKNAIATFLEKLRSPNPRPKKRRKGIRRRPIFATGDCLALRLSNGEFGAAIVLDCPLEDERPGVDTYGRNLIGVLRYKSPQKPSQDVFERRNWLRVTRHAWDGVLAICNTTSQGFRRSKDLFHSVGKTRIRPDDPSQSSSYVSWPWLPEQVELQARWEVGEREMSWEG